MVRKIIACAQIFPNHPIIKFDHEEPIKGSVISAVFVLGILMQNNLSEFMRATVTGSEVMIRINCIVVR